MNSSRLRIVIESGFFAVTLLASLPAAAKAAAGEVAPVEYCRSMYVEPPGPAFPANSTAPIRVSISDPTIDQAFDAYASPEIFVKTDAGWEPVDYDLVDPGVAPLVRDLVPLQYRVGDHIVTWNSDCDGPMSPVDPAQMTVGTFQVLPEAELPTSLGTASMTGEAFAGRNPYWGSEYTVDPAPSLEPWASTSKIGLEIDGVLVAAPESSSWYRRGELIVRDYVHDCGGAVIQPGPHDATVLVTVNDIELRSEPIAIDIECLPPEKGCSVAGANSASWLPLAVLIVVGLRRSRRRLVR